MERPLLAYRFKKARKDAKLSLDELARRTGISRGYLWKLETPPGRNPSLEVLMKICEVYGATTSELLGEQRRLKKSPAVLRLKIWLCELCLAGAGGECGVPGCALFMNRAPDLRIGEELYAVIERS